MKDLVIIAVIIPLAGAVAVLSQLPVRDGGRPVETPPEIDAAPIPQPVDAALEPGVTATSWFGQQEPERLQPASLQAAPVVIH